MSASDNVEYQEPWNEDELNQIPFGFEPLLVTGFANKEIVFSAKWRSEALIAPTPTGPWHIIQPGTDKREPLTASHWKVVHPGIQHLDITDWHNLAGTYNEKNIRWSRTQNRFVYDNSRPVNFPAEEEDETAEVSQLLETSQRILERTTAKVSPETTTSTLLQMTETPKQELARKVLRNSKPTTSSCIHIQGKTTRHCSATHPPGFQSS